VTPFAGCTDIAELVVVATPLIPEVPLPIRLHGGCVIVPVHTSVGSVTGSIALGVLTVVAVPDAVADVSCVLTGPAVTLAIAVAVAVGYCTRMLFAVTAPTPNTIVSALSSPYASEEDVPNAVIEPPATRTATAVLS
jgi:hypothetical protein